MKAIQTHIPIQNSEICPKTLVVESGNLTLWEILYLATREELRPASDKVWTLSMLLVYILVHYWLIKNNLSVNDTALKNMGK